MAELKRIKLTCRKCGHKQNIIYQPRRKLWQCGVCAEKQEIKQLKG